VYADMNKNLEVREVWNSGYSEGAWLSSAAAGRMLLSLYTRLPIGAR
jgi:hypothetical protein